MAAVEHQATAARCKNVIYTPGMWRGYRCDRDANPEKDGLCNVCHAAKKRGLARRARTTGANKKRFAAEIERNRKLAAHDDLVAALTAVECDMNEYNTLTGATADMIDAALRLAKGEAGC